MYMYAHIHLDVFMYIYIYIYMYDQIKKARGKHGKRILRALLMRLVQVYLDVCIKYVYRGK
jgi:hypothetical protein